MGLVCAMLFFSCIAINGCLHQLLTPVQKDKQKQAIDLMYVKLPYSVKFSRDKIFVEINFADQVAA